MIMAKKKESLIPGMKKNLSEGVIERQMYGGDVTLKFYGPTELKPSRHMYYVGGKRMSGSTTFIGIIDKSKALVSWATDLALEHLAGMIQKEQEIGVPEVMEACSLHEVRKQEAADIGTKIHEWCEEYIRFQVGEPDSKMPEMPEDEAIQVGVTAFLDWVDANKVKFVYTELPLYSKKYKYVGTADIGAVVNGKMCLIDLKTSNDLYNSVRLQTASYVRADEEESERRYDGRWAIRLAKETEKEYVARMTKKNALRTLKGKQPLVIKPYQAFEAMYLDEEGTEMERDFKAFVASLVLYQWNQETDFYKTAAR